MCYYYYCCIIVGDDQNIKFYTTMYLGKTTRTFQLKRLLHYYIDNCLDMTFYDLLR